MRIATFNVENLDEGGSPTLADRIPVLRVPLSRMNADIICFQEVHGQNRPGADRDIHALRSLLVDTPYDDWNIEFTRTSQGQAYRYRNLVTVSRYPIVDSHSYNRDLLSNSLQYNLVSDTDDEAKNVRWERPIFHTEHQLPDGRSLHVINLHLKSRRPISIESQQINAYTWRTVSGWAEAFFVSSMKRVGQSLETRILIDQLFDADPDAMIVVCGDLNAHSDEVPIEAISGRVENTGNRDLIHRVMLPTENSVPESLRFSYIHQGKRNLLDHMLVSRSLLHGFKGAEIYNEGLHDESVAFASDTKYPESDHAAFVAEIDLA